MFGDVFDPDRKVSSERRTKRRFPLRCPMSLNKIDPRNRSVRATGETINVSSLGFYGVVDKLFEPGEHLDCELKLPAESPEVMTGPKLKCNAVVLRVDERMDGQFGVACMITNYSFSATDASRV